MTDVGASDELMDRLYRRQRHVYDATRKYYLLGRDRLIRRLDPPAGSRVLEIGCGTARNLIVAARAYRDVHFFGIDISSEMLGTARHLVEREGLGADIRLARADATAFDPALLFGVPGFSRIFISYSLSMMPGWQAVLERSLAWLAPGGELHVVDFGGQERLPGWVRQVLREWLRMFHVTPRDDLEAELTLLGLRVGALTIFERPFRGYAQYAICRRLAG
jgi:S-adenosylmethionine-diacylgycerolhomoserine-N-methlytransferase